MFASKKYIECDSMKVILINPPEYQGYKYVREGRCEQRTSSYQYSLPPLSLMSIAAVLEKEGINVKILDCIAKDISLGKLEKILEKERPELIIVNLSTPSYYGDVKVADISKKLNIFSAVIGVHSTALPDETLSGTNFDAVIRGEPEITARELAEELEKNPPRLEKVNGLSYKVDKKIYHNASRQFIKNLDELPFPARHMIDNKKYLFPFSEEPWTLLSANRGCPYNCIFCTAHLYCGKHQRFRSPQNIADEIEEIVTKFRIKKIGMWGEIFTLNKNMVEKVCNEIKRRNLDIDWYITSRVDSLDRDRIKNLMSAGCRALTLGVESGSQKILNNIKKGITVQQILRAIRLSRKYGLETQAHLIFGLPGETNETIKETIKFINKVNPDYANFYCAIPFPGTEFWDYAIKNNYLLTRDWSKFEINNAIISYPNLKASEIQNAKRMAFIKFYFRQNKIAEVLNKHKISEYKKLIKDGYTFFREWVM
jgi:radical SAM superfamily enzyme YgiQ (UPF0313 family)